MPAESDSSADFLQGGGEMGDRVRAFDWSATPLGPIEHWPQSLKTATFSILHSPAPIMMLWGPDGVMIYNDAYSVFVGDRHPALLGAKVQEAAPEMAEFNANVLKVGLAGGSLAYRDHELVLRRNGQPHRVWLNLDFSPIADERGKPGGVFAIVMETTERVLADRRKEAERERQRRLFEQAPGSIIITRGPNHVVEFVNEAHCKLFDSRDWVGKELRAAFPNAIGQGVYEMLDSVYSTGAPIAAKAVDVRVRRDSAPVDERRFLTFTYAPTFDDDGAITGVFCEGLDVTDTQLVEAALHESEDRLRLATEAAAIGTWDFNPITRELRWDARCKALFGLPPDAPITYDVFLAGLHPNDRDVTDAAVQSALQHGTKYDIEYRTIGLQDGIERWIAATGDAIFANGRAVRFIGTVIDISDRKLSARRLEILNETGAAVAAELDLERIVQMITDAGVELTGAQFGAFFYNELDENGDAYRLYTLSGAPRAAFESFPMPRITAVFSPTFTGERAVRSDDILNDPLYGRNEPHRGMPKGHLPVRAYLAVPVVASSGQVHGALLFGHGKPGVFKQEHEALALGLAGQAATAIDNARLVLALQTLNQNLEQRVADAVADRMMAEEQLRQSQKMEAIGQLTGGIAHDFNNMLAVVIGALNLMRRRLDRGDANIGKYIDAATDGANRAASLTQRLLAFSRQQPLAPEAIDANRLVTSMTDLLARTLGEHIVIEPALSAGLWRIHADAPQLESALVNLAVNARDAMPGGGKLTIETANVFVDDHYAKEVEIAPGQYVLLAVTDTGGGMAADILDRAFEPFFTTKSVGKGTGLGLSQVFGFIRQSGGFVKIYSELGVGTTVKMYLPRFFGADVRPKAVEEDTPPPAGQPVELILVVEDDERVRNYSVEALRELGYSVLAASGGAEALELLETRDNIALLFTDVVMPEMTGRQLADIVKKQRPDIKVLFTTGYTRNAVVHNGVLDPGVNFLLKPFTIDELAHKVRNALDRS